MGAMIALAALAAGTLLLAVLLALACRLLFGLPADNPHVIVLVLGDIGRSPRMQYHSLSLARHGCNVTIIGYPGAQPIAELQTNSHIRIRHVIPLELAWLPFSIRAGVKVVSLLLRLLAQLFTSPCNIILVQNPPAIPSLLVARLASTLQGASFIIDFHNFGYSLLALKLGEQHPLVQAHQMYEKLIGRFADDAFCVTRQMQEVLQEEWKVTARPLHDRPARIFRPTEVTEQHDLFQRLRAEGMLTALDDWWSGIEDGQTLFTNISCSGDCSKAAGRPHLVVSSTSWTPDEDFGQLLDALPAFDGHLTQAGMRAVIMVTGKGDLRQPFEDRLREMAPQLQAVRVLTVWLSFADYALLLGSADLGLSLHSSSSGIDLPMKVVDMFGAGLPVCARSFAALPELVLHGENGLVFNSTEELAVSLAHGLGAAASSALPLLKSPAGKPKLNGWDDNWDAIAWPVFQTHLRGCTDKKAR